jgi:hypothetical protein
MYKISFYVIATRRMRLRLASIAALDNNAVIIFAIVAATLLVSGELLNFNSSSYPAVSDSNRAFADPPPWTRNPHNAGMGIVGMSVLAATSPNCDLELSTPDSNKAGESVMFKVPSGVNEVVKAGETNKPANYHIAFEGDDNLYYEVGIYYGDWSRDPGIGYNATKFQIAWGIGGILRGVSSIPVVAGHTLELSILYSQNATGQWQVRMDDLDDKLRSAQIVDIGHSSMKVKSDYFTFVEAGSFAPNTNTQRLGLIEVLDIRQATRTLSNDNEASGNGSGGSSSSGDKISLTTWTNGYLLMDCSPANNSYGVTYLGNAGKFEIGYGGATTKSGHQFW